MKCIITPYTGTGGSEHKYTAQKRGSFYIVRPKKGVQKKRAVKVVRYQQRFRQATLSWFGELSLGARNDWDAYAAANPYITGLPPFTKISGINYYVRQSMWHFAVDNSPYTGQELSGVTTLLNFSIDYIYSWQEQIPGDLWFTHHHLILTPNLDGDDDANVGTKYQFTPKKTLGAWTSKAKWYLNGPRGPWSAGVPVDTTLDELSEKQFVPTGAKFVMGVYMQTGGNLSAPKFVPVTMHDAPD